MNLKFSFGCTKTSGKIAEMPAEKKVTASLNPPLKAGLDESPRDK